MSEKVKSRFTALDVTAMVNNLRNKLIGMRINNIYDLNSKTYVLKLARPDHKEYLLLESGVRFHTTHISKEKNKLPSGFAMKLRKHLRTRRLENIEQIGVERVVDFTIGTDENTFHIILELYASGNVILTDKDYRILQLLRVHNYTDTIKVAIGQVYPFEYAAKLKLENFKTDEKYIEDLMAIDEGKNEDNEQENNQKDGKKANNKKANNANQKKQNVKKIKEIFFKIIPSLHQAMIDNILNDYKIPLNSKATKEHIPALKKAADETIKFLFEFKNANPLGYLTYKVLEDEKEKSIKENDNQINISEGDQEKKKIKYFEFLPLKPKESMNILIKELPSFDQAVDEFFSIVEEPIDAKKEKEKLAWKKYENIKEDQENRIKKLKQEQEEFSEKASLIQQNIDEVDAIINIISTMVQGGLSWDKILKMVNESKKAGDPLANVISKLKMENNQVVLLLGDPTDLKAPLMEVEVDFRMKAFMNAEKYFQDKKKFEIKEKKTLEATNQALKLAEKAALNEVHMEKQKSSVLITRKTYWFEKFNWFISSENYLIIGGKDAQQNQVLVKKYMEKGDIYMHADIHGAATVIVKNPLRKPIPKNTLEESAAFTICRSKAWESKIVTSAWWVYDHQVSRTAPTGEYLPTGSFMIRGKKNFLNPFKLEMGFGILFKIDDSCLGRHINDRKAKIEDDQHNIIPMVEEGQIVDIDEKVDIINYNQTQPRIIIPNKTKPEKKPEKKVEPEKVSEGSDENEGKDESDGEEEEETQKNEERKTGGNEKANQKDKDKKNPNQKNKQKDQPLADVNLSKLPRGKRNKLKKIKEKYADQDEEEKLLKFKLIGAKDVLLTNEAPTEESKNKQKNADNKKDKSGQGKKNQDKNEKSKKDQNNGKNDKKKGNTKNIQEKESQKRVDDAIKQEKKDKIPAPIIENPPVKDITKESINQNVNIPKEVKVNPLETNKIDIKPPPDPNKTNINIEEKKEPGNDEDSDDLEEKNDVFPPESLIKDKEIQDEDDLAFISEDSQLSELSKLISVPHPEDILLFAVPVCAPYITIRNYKYKAKLIPGTLKRGKSVKLVMNLFTTQKDIIENEKKLLKALSDNELVTAMIGDVKVAAEGLLKIKQQEKKAKMDKKKDMKKDKDNKKENTTMSKQHNNH